MSVTQYVGARYVPLFHTPIEWDSAVAYEPLTIVIHEGNSYTSKQSVPVGIDISNETYWVVTGNYNAQVETYRRETKAVSAQLDAVKSTADKAQNTADAAAAKNDEQDTVISEVKSSVETEVTNRTDADAALGTRIDGVSADIATEVTDRKAVVEKLEAEIEKAAASGLYKNVSDYGASESNADNSDAINAALADGSAYIDGANYAIQNPIVVPSGRRLFGINGATVTISKGDLGLTNEHDGTTTGYTQASDISVENIKFVVSHASECTTIGFGHASNVSVVGCEFSGNKKWHMIEFNACTHCVADGNYFHNYGNADTGGTEMVQLDYASGTSVFPWFGPYDNSGCYDVKIINNFFEGDGSKSASIPAAIGNHTTSNDKSNHSEKVIIANNLCYNMGGFCKFVDLGRATIANNVSTYCRTAINLSYGCNYITVANNILQGDNAGSVASTNGRGVWTYASTSSSYPEHVSLMNNKIYNFATHGVCLQGRLHMVVGNEITACRMNGIYSGYDEGGSYYGNNICYGNHADGDDYFDLYYNAKANTLTTGLIGDNVIESCKFSNASCVGSDGGYHIVINNVFKNAFSTTVSNMKLHGNLVSGSLQADKNV